MFELDKLVQKSQIFWPLGAKMESDIELQESQTLPLHSMSSTRFTNAQEEQSVKLVEVVSDVSHEKSKGKELSYKSNW